MWNWIKINDIKDLPKFGVPVVLYQEKDGKKYAMIGWLASIDVDGANWDYYGQTSLFSIFGIPPIKKDFIPTHWCAIEIPKNDLK